MIKLISFIFLFLLTGCYPIWAAEVLVSIDKDQQEMTVFVDSVEQYRWPVSTGTRGYDTPSGTFVASSMNEIWYSKQWDNAPMPHAVFFTKEGHAIHGTQEVSKLGTAASHGCVRLSPENAATLYALVEANGLESTQVVLTGTEYPVEEDLEARQQDPGPDSYEDYPVRPREYDDEFGPYFGSPYGGFELNVPGFQLQFKLDRKAKRKWRKKRRFRD